MTTQQIGVKAIIEKNGKILLIRRSSKYEHLTHAWDIPGGRLEFGEEPEDGLRREVKEETGLNLEEIKQILDATTVFKNEEKQIVRITYLCSVKETNQTEKISDEHTSLEWIPQEKLKTLEFKDIILKKVIDRYNFFTHLHKIHESTTLGDGMLLLFIFSIYFFKVKIKK